MIAAPIYLVSACRSGEEFVAAFRRYADRNGLFVPIADPIPAGRRGRFAVTLSDGGVMIEGDGEVISASTSPSVLHGRVGMTIRFGELDTASKTVMVELEQARLVMRPQAPSVTPRPAELPAEPRPVPPSPAGRIDLHNARAQCVAIGDVAALQVVEPKPAPKGGARFVVPTIPPVAGARSRTTSAPPLVTASPDAKPAAVPIPSLPRTETVKGVAPRTSKPASVPPPLPSPRRADALEPPALPRTDTVKDVGAHPIENADPDDSDVMTTIGPVPRPPGAFSATLPAITLAELAHGRDTIPQSFPAHAAKRAESDPDTSPNEPLAVDERRETPTEMAAAMPTSRARQMAAVAGPDPTPADALPIASPRSSLEASPASVATVEDEATDMTAIPASSITPAEGEHVVPQIEDELVPQRPPPRSTTIGVAVSPSGATVLPALAAPPPPAAEDESTQIGLIPTRRPATPAPVVEPALAVADETQESTEVAPIPLRPPAVTPPRPTEPAPKPVLPRVEEPTPSGDWTMTPGDEGPTIQPRKKSASGDWMIARDPQAPDGWSEPSQVDKPAFDANGIAKPEPRGAVKPATPRKPSTPAVATARPARESESRPQRVATSAPVEPKVQIDPTLIQPPLEAIVQLAAETPGSGAVRAQPYPVASSELLKEARHAVVQTPPQGTPTSASYSDTQLARLGFAPKTPLPATTSTSGPVATPFLSDRTSVVKGRSKRLGVIIGSAIVAVVAGIAAFIVLGGDPPSESPGVASATVPDPVARPVDVTRPSVEGSAVGSDGSGSASDEPSSAGIGSGSAEAVAPADAGTPAIGSAAVPPPSDKPPATACSVEVTSAPPGAQIVIDDAVIGTTPQSVSLPCDRTVKVVLRKPRYITVLRNVVATEGAKVKVALGRAMLSVKVSSQPTGATITMNGKTLGVTPTTVKLPAFEASSLTIAKDGYTADTQRITPKQNNQAIHAQLKKRGRPGR